MKNGHFLATFKSALFANSILQSNGKLRLGKTCNLHEPTVSLPGELLKNSKEIPNLLTLDRWSRDLNWSTGFFWLGILITTGITGLAIHHLVTNPTLQLLIKILQP